MAYEMRRRGYDVEATPASYTSNNDIDEIVSWYKNPEPYNITTDHNDVEGTADAIRDHLSTYGKGSRGQFILYWSEGGGHSVVWEVQDDDEVVLRDCQTNETIEIEDYVKYADTTVFFRTDNLELKKGALKTVRNK